MNKEKDFKGDYIKARDIFIAEAKKKNYPKDTVELAIMLCLTTIAIDKVGTYEKALNIATKICKQNSNDDKFIVELSIALGIDKPKISF